MDFLTVVAFSLFFLSDLVTLATVVEGIGVVLDVACVVVAAS